MLAYGTSHSGNLNLVTENENPSHKNRKTMPDKSSSANYTVIDLGLEILRDNEPDIFKNILFRFIYTCRHHRETKT